MGRPSLPNYYKIKEDKMNDTIELKILRYPKLAKCSSCSRVRDIYYKALIYDVDDKKSIVGDLDLCKLCGENIHRGQGGGSGRSNRSHQIF